MFKPLGLFADSPCPGLECHRPRCFFGHQRRTLQSITKNETTPLQRRHITSNSKTVPLVKVLAETVVINDNPVEWDIAKEPAVKRYKAASCVKAEQSPNKDVIITSVKPPVSYIL